MRTRSLAVIFCALCVGCQPHPAADGPDFSIVFFNVQNLFDATTDGDEYPEFRDPSTWSAGTAASKMRAIAQALNSIPTPPDVVVLAEVEKVAVAQELFHRHLPDLKLRHVVGTDWSGGCIDLVVGSRWTILESRVHLPVVGGEFPLRPVLEVRLQPSQGDPLVIIANHWKSRRGGELETGPLRQASADLVRRRLALIGAEDSTLPVVVIGDFNDDPAEVADRLRVEELTCGWDYCDASGSYRYSGRWHRFDGAYLDAELFDGSGWEFWSFGPIINEHTASGDGTPRRFIPGHGGCSDHLPVEVLLSYD